MRIAGHFAIGLALVRSAASAGAEPVSVAALLATKDEIRMDFEGSNHFVLMVRREGTAEEGTTGPFAGAHIVEHGWHDVDPPAGAHPQGYLTLATAAGDIAYIRFTVRAVFFAGSEKPRLSDRGFWELVDGTGRFEGMRGLGTVVIEPKGAPGTRFVLEGEIDAAP